MKKPDIKETHVRSSRVVIERRILERLLTEWAMEQVNFTDFATTAKVSFLDATEGSPPYKVGVYCTVDLTEDQKLLPVCGP